LSAIDTLAAVGDPLPGLLELLAGKLLGVDDEAGEVSICLDLGIDDSR